MFVNPIRQHGSIILIDHQRTAALVVAIKARISSTLHAVVRGPRFTLAGKRPDRVPAHHVDLETGIQGGGIGFLVANNLLKGQVIHHVKSSVDLDLLNQAIPDRREHICLQTAPSCFHMVSTVAPFQCSCHLVAITRNGSSLLSRIDLFSALRCDIGSINAGDKQPSSGGMEHPDLS
jgi:hypothetical protein